MLDGLGSFQLLEQGSEMPLEHSLQQKWVCFPASILAVSWRPFFIFITWIGSVDAEHWGELV